METLTIYSDEELKRIQGLELECLKVIIKICENIGVEYFLIGGTALGAIRHQGFIPWDDDIDIGMTRENYVKFLKQAPIFLPSQYHLQTPYEGTNNPYFYSKIRINGTKFVEYSNHRVDMHQGLYIDIFPFDEVPDNEEENKLHFKTVQKLIRIFTLRQSPDVSMQPKNFKDHIKAIARRGIHCLYKKLSYSKIANELEKTITKYNGTNQSAYGCLNFPVRKTEYIKKEDLYPLVDHKFEDIVAKIPNNYEAYLTTHYGDYMKLPPKEKRFGHKPYKIDLG
jgi:lipopolysaccharide cholinephosphotransferase